MDELSIEHGERDAGWTGGGPGGAAGSAGSGGAAGARDGGYEDSQQGHDASTDGSWDDRADRSVGDEADHWASEEGDRSIGDEADQWAGDEADRSMSDEPDVAIADEPDGIVPPDVPDVAPPVPLASVRSILLPLTRDRVMTDVFAVFDDGKLYVNHRANPDVRYTGFGRVTGPDSPPVPPFASLAGVCRDSRHLDVFYVDTVGRVEVVSFDPDQSVYHLDHVGGTGATAPPGTSLSVVSMSSDRLDLFFVDNTGTAVVFEWTVAGGWKPAVRLSEVGRFLPGAPLTAVSRIPASTLAVYGVDKDGFAWTAQCDQGCDGSNWAARRFADAPKFGPRTPLSVLVLDTATEDVFGTDGDGRVWRAWWTAQTGTWSHPPDYSPFGVFSRQFMLAPGAAIETNTRNFTIANLMTSNDRGIMVSEWVEFGKWQPQGKPWESTLVDDAWPTFDRGWGTVEPNMPPAMLGNVGSDEAADIYWTSVPSPGVRQIWTVRVHRAPMTDWIWTPYFRIDVAGAYK